MLERGHAISQPGGRAPAGHAAAGTEADDDSPTAQQLAAALPEDALCVIFRSLDVPDLGSCDAACRAWYRVLRDEDGAMNLIWRHKMEERWWSSVQQSARDWNRAGDDSARTLLRRKVCDAIRLRDDLTDGRFADSCHLLRPRLMRGHTKEVRSAERFGDFCVTCSQDGEMRQWRLPVEGTHPEGTVIFPRHDLVGSIEHAERIDDETMVVSGNGGVAAVVRFDATEGGVECRIIQLVYCGRVSTLCVGTTLGNNRAAALICGFSDGTMRVFPVYTNTEESANSSADASPIEVNRDEARAVLSGHRSCVNSAVCLTSEEGTMMLSTSADQTVRMWNYTTGECRWTAHFDGAIGGPCFLGATSKEFAVHCDTLEQCSVQICRLSDGVTVRVLPIPGRVQELYERSILCGTNDGSLVEFDLDTGKQTLEWRNALTSPVQSVWHLGRDAAVVLGDDGQMRLLELRAKVTLRQIALKMRYPRVCLYDSDKRTLLVASSSGNLVRALVFV